MELQYPKSQHGVTDGYCDILKDIQVSKTHSNKVATDLHFYYGPLHHQALPTLYPDWGYNNSLSSGCPRSKTHSDVFLQPQEEVNSLFRIPRMQFGIAKSTQAMKRKQFQIYLIHSFWSWKSHSSLQYISIFCLTSKDILSYFNLFHHLSTTALRNTQMRL